jgi:hypothetical protein
MADLQQRYLNILKMPRQAVASIPTFGSLGTTSGDADSSVMSKILSYGLRISLFLFVVMLILYVINYILILYKKPPIFDFGNSPNALIPITPKNAADWKKYWTDSTKLTAAEAEMPKYNYTMIFDIIILEDKDIKSDRPSIAFYRNASPVTTYTSFLDYSKEIVDAKSPNLYVTYNAHLSEVHIIIKLTKEASPTTPSSRTLKIPIVAQKQYRIAINVEDKLVEAYKDGVWIQTVTFSNDGLPAGDTTDKFYYTPDDDINAIRVRNLMLVSPGITSGIIRNMGQASINLDDLKKDGAGNLCAS